MPALPCQDLPFHAAALRVIHDYRDPRYGFEPEFVLTLGRTQYFGFYLLGSLLAGWVGVPKALLLLVSAYLGGSILALRTLLVDLGRDPRLCALAVPLLYGRLFVIGLFPFLLGVPLMLLGLALSVRHHRSPTAGRGAALAALLLVLFYLHIVPLGVVLIAYAALFPWRSPRAWGKHAWPLGPCMVAVGWWLAATDAGRQVLELSSDRSPPLELGVRLHDLYAWLGDAFRDRTDEVIFGALACAAVAGHVLGVAQGDGRMQPRRYTVVPAASGLLYFVLEREHGMMWPLSQRFATIAALTAIPVLRMPKGRSGALVGGAFAALALACLGNVVVHFRRFAREVGPFDDALAQIAPRSRVAGLMYQRSSAVVTSDPFLHFVSYVQAEKGGVVQFSFAGYNHWPFDYREGHFPPPGSPARPKWEWTPELVTIDDLVPYYDCVLTRGDGFAPPAGTYALKWRGGPWSVWSRSP